MSEQEVTNQFEIDGEVIQLDGDKATVKVITEGANRKFEELLVITVPPELIGSVKPGHLQSFAGQMKQGEEGEARETQLLALDVQDAHGYFNFAKLLGEVWTVDFHSAKPKLGKKQFLNLFVKESGNETNGINTVAFRGLSATLKDLARGSIVEMCGQVRRKAYSDGSGRYSTDLILDPAKTDIIFEAKARKLRKIGGQADKKADKKAKKKV